MSLTKQRDDHHPKVLLDELVQKALIRKDYILYSCFATIYNGYISVICCQMRRSLARIERTRSSNSRK